MSVPSNADSSSQDVAPGAVEDGFFVLNLSHHTATQFYIGLWRPEDCGYTYTLSRAGVYTRESIQASMRYYHSGHSNIAVPVRALLGLGVDPLPGELDDSSSQVLPNTKEAWKAILAALEFAPLEPAKPLWLRSEEKIYRVMHPQEYSNPHWRYRARGG